MAVIQSLSCQLIPETMAELAMLVFLIIMKHRCNNLRVDFIDIQMYQLRIRRSRRACHRLCAEDGQVICATVDELCSSHKEADTRLLLHAFHASCEEH